MKVKRSCFIWLSYLILISLSPAAIGQTILEDSILNGGNFDKAYYRLWLNSQTKNIRGVIVIMPGSNGDGRNLVKDTIWQNLASRHQMALMGCFYADKLHENMAIESYVDVKNGSGQALLEVLQKFSVTSKHPELSEAPLALWGMSAGGEFNYEFVCWKPERVIAFIVNKGGIYYSSLAPSAAWEVPGVFFTGSMDSPFRNNIIKGIFSINRRFGAKWIFAEESGAAHVFANSAVFARFFFDEVIPLRLPAVEKGKSTPLVHLTSPGYIGTIKSRRITPDLENGQLLEVTSWFPNKEVALAWKEFVKIKPLIYLNIK